VGVGVSVRALACACSSVALHIQHPAHAPYCVRPPGFTNFFDVISQAARFSEKEVTEYKMLLRFSLQILFETFLILRRI
jgi:hypothetical protein